MTHRPDENDAAKSGGLGDAFEDATPYDPRLVDADAEDRAISGILRAGDAAARAVALDAVLRVAKPGAFTQPRSIAVLKALLDGEASGATPDAHLIERMLKESRKLDAIGGSNAIRALVDLAGDPALVETYARKVADRFERRSLVSVGRILVTADRVVNVESIRELASSALDRYESSARSAFAPISAALPSVRERMSRRPDPARDVTTGMIALDSVLAPLDPGQVMVVAGRPGMGKTALLNQIALDLADRGQRVGFVSLEMPREDLLIRSISNLTGRDTRDFRPGKANVLETSDVVAAIDRLRQMALEVDDSTPQRADDIRRRVRALHRAGPLNALLIDHLGEIASPTGMEKQNQTEIVSANVAAVRELAREFRIPVILACQLNRAATTATKKQPTLTDLRQSGRIEEIADVVVLLHRPHYYDAKRPSDEAELIVGKNRRGQSGDTVRVRWEPQCQRFGDYIIPDDRS
jgi:replicative DNA helicase